MRNGQTLHDYLSELETPAFMKPFYCIVLLTIKLCSARHDEAIELLRGCWNTSYGGGRVINGLLFGGRHIVCQSMTDIRSGKKPRASTPKLTSLKANAILGYMLMGSEFGRRLMSSSSLKKRCVLARQSETLHVQRFLYKLCEIRKTNVSCRRRWHRLWKDARVRNAHLKKQRGKRAGPWW